MDPTVAVSENLPHSPKSSKGLTSIIWYALITIAVLVGIIYLFRYINSRTSRKTQKAVAQQVSQIHKKRDIKGGLIKALKLNFSSSKYYEDINVYMNQAEKAKTTELTYQNYVKAFSFASKAYSQSKDPKQRVALLDFQDFLKAFPFFKEADAVVPK